MHVGRFIFIFLLNGPKSVSYALNNMQLWKGAKQVLLGK